MADFMKLDDDFESFIKKYINTFVKWELVQFFHNNETKFYSVNELAQKLNRSSKTLKSEVVELEEKGLLKESEEQELSFQLIQDDTNDKKALLALMKCFVEFCETREGRLRVIYKILKDGKPINN